jgi:hypothetical protein
MSNFLKETLECLKSNDHDETHVVWVGSSDGKYRITWEEFAALADFEYYAGFGGQEVADDLVIVGEDWWLERSEYDGSESWDYMTLPVASKKPKKFATVCNGDSWASIEEMNSPGGKYK